MSDRNGVMECQEYQTLPEEVVETSYMCGECFSLFPSTEAFNAHNCQESQVDGVESVVEQDGSCGEEVADPLGDDNNPCVWETQESEAAMEEAVANILGEKMKKMAPQKRSDPVMDFDHTLSMQEGEPSIEHTGIMDQQMDSVVEHTVENKDMVEIPSANVYMYDNPIYLNRLMKDNTFGRRVRHDAPYRQRLGPWDNKSSRSLIKLLKEYPKAYFILDKECKRTEAWEMIRNKMSESGHQFTVLQIRMRWRELVKSYRTTINYNDLHNVRRSCQYFEELNDLFGVWDYTSTVLLIRQMELHGGKRLGQNGGTRMRFKIWNYIRLVLEAQGYNFTADQVQGRWGTLINLYQRMVENNSKPHTEKISMAFKEHMERVFNYVPERNYKWRKIVEKRGKTPKSVKRNWTHPIEKVLLSLYRDRIYRFNNEHIKKSDLWEEIIQGLNEETEYSTTVDKARARFNELTKQFTTVEQHNSQSGTIRRECKHHELLSEIYSVYNYWPHDKSTIKINKSNAVRMRQVNAQLAWSEDQSRALLQLYPQVLVNHISSGDHQPIEEFWLQLAKAYLNTQGDRKQCYEIEEHIALLRRGYQSRNPFPYCSEMQLIEETEVTLEFSPDPIVTESDQLVPYWSHNAAILLLDLLIMYRQDGIKNVGLFEIISRDLGNHGYRYTGEECRMYYFLLRQLYTNRLRTLRRNRELIKPFPYMDKMAEVDAVVSLPKFVETNKNREVIISTATSLIRSVEGETNEEKDLSVLSYLSDIRLQLRQRNLLHPLPSVKKVGQILKEVMSDLQNNQDEVIRLRAVLNPVAENLNTVTERTPSNVITKIVKDDKKEKISMKRVQQPKSGIQWTEDNVKIMLDVIKEWRLLSHDTAEFEAVLGVNSPVWKDVATRVKCGYKVSPNKCQERFSQLCREYKSVVAFNARLGSGEPAKSVICQEHLQSVLSPLVFHTAELDPRDEWAIHEGEGVPDYYKTAELLFTVKELSWLCTEEEAGSFMPNIDWEVVSLFMIASGYSMDTNVCQKQFEELMKEYEAAARHNESCGLKNRKRPPFYYKIRTLFLTREVVNIEPDPGMICKLDIDELEIQEVLVQLLKDFKRSYCHSVPRRCLLLLLARMLDKHFLLPCPTFSAHKVWQEMVKLHTLHQEAIEQSIEVDCQRNLGNVWQSHPSPLVAFNLLAVPLMNWKLTNEWIVDEVYLLVDSVINWELQPRSLQTPEKNISQSASEALQSQGYQKSPKECYEQWQYLAFAYNYGGYRNFAEQLCILHLITPSALQLKPSGMQVKTPLKFSDLENQTKSSKGSVMVVESQNVLDQGVISSEKIQKTEKMPEHESSFELSQKRVSNLSMNQSRGSDKKVKSCSRSKNSSKDKHKVTAPGNVASYVHINVPKQKRSVPVSTDEVYVLENSDVYKATKRSKNFSKTCKNTAVSIPSATLDIKVENKVIKNEQLPTPNEQSIILVKDVAADISSILSKHEHCYYFKCTPSSGERKVKVDVLKVMASEKSTVIECKTKGSSPRTLMLHCPMDYSIPTDMVQVFVPYTLAYPERDDRVKVNLGLNENLDFSKHEIKNEIVTCEDNLDYVELNVNVDDLELLQESNVIKNEVTSNRKFSGLEVVTLLEKYKNQVCQERLALMKVLQDTQSLQTAKLRHIFNVFQEICNSLD